MDNSLVGTIGDFEMVVIYGFALTCLSGLSKQSGLKLAIRRNFCSFIEHTNLAKFLKGLIVLQFAELMGLLLGEIIDNSAACMTFSAEFSISIILKFCNISNRIIDNY